MSPPELEQPAEFSDELPGRSSEAVSAILKRVLKADQVRKQAALADVEQAWNAAIGSLAEHTVVRGLRGGTLHVGVSSPAVLCELKGYYERAALDHLRRTLPRRGVRQVRYVVTARGSESEA